MYECIGFTNYDNMCIFSENIFYVYKSTSILNFEDDF